MDYHEARTENSKPAEELITDTFANITGGGVGRSRVQYLLTTLRDDMAAFRRLGSTHEAEVTEAKAFEFAETINAAKVPSWNGLNDIERKAIAKAAAFSAYLYTAHQELVNKIVEMWNKGGQDRQDLFAVIENQGYYLWFNKATGMLGFTMEGNTASIMIPTDQ